MRDYKYPQKVNRARVARASAFDFVALVVVGLTIGVILGIQI